MTSAGVKVAILVDDQAGDGLVAEHGLSLRIETEGKRILFDTGQGILLENNARALGVDLKKTDILVLSHGHSDHTGGIHRVLRESRNIDVYGHPGIVLPRYRLRNGMTEPIQIPHQSMAAIDELPSGRLHWIQGPTILSDKIGLTGPIPRETSFEDTGGSFFLDPHGTRADPIEDDLALWIRTDEGLIICVGCAHAGLVNTLNYVRRLNRGLRIRAIIGGFHLLTAGRKRLDQTIIALQRFEPNMVVPCHCTGELAVAVLRNALGERVSPGAAGMTFRF